MKNWIFSNLRNERRETKGVGVCGDFRRLNFSQDKIHNHTSVRKIGGPKTKEKDHKVVLKKWVSKSNLFLFKLFH